MIHCEKDCAQYAGPERAFAGAASPLATRALCVALLLLLLTANAFGATDLSTKEVLPDSVHLSGGWVVPELFGWSQDSRYFAFGEIGEGNDPLDVAQGFCQYWIVDAAKDEFVKGTTMGVSYSEGTSIGPTQIDSVRALFLEQLAEFGFHVGGSPKCLLVNELRILERSRARDRAEMSAVTFRDNGCQDDSYQLVMSKEFQGEGDDVQGRFTLTLTNEGSGRTVWLQKAGKFFAGREGYYIHSAYVDRGTKNIAILTLKVHRGFEGAKEPHFMVNTGRMP